MSGSTGSLSGSCSSYVCSEKPSPYPRSSPVPVTPCDPPPPLCRSYRLVMAVLVFSCNAISFADRALMSLAVVHMPALDPQTGQHYAWKSWILSSFFAGYLLTMLPAGYFSLTLPGGGWTLSLVAVAVWSFFTFLTALGDSLLSLDSALGPLLLCLIRVGMGAGEGMCPPAHWAIYGAWLPLRERSRLMSVMLSGMDIGTISCLILAGPCIQHFGWQSMFLFWGAMAFVWLPLFYLYGAGRPEQHARCVATGEADYIVRNRGHVEDLAEPATRGFSLSQVLASYAWALKLRGREPLWAIYICNFGFFFGWYCVLSWLPSYLGTFEGYDIQEKPLLLPMPYVACWVGGLTSGFVADFLVARGLSLTTVRKLVNSLATFGGAALLLLTTALAGSAEMASAGMCGSLFLGRWMVSGFFASIVDVCPGRAGQLVGVSNTLGTLPGILVQPITQAILDASGGDWFLVMLLPAGMSVLGGAVFLRWADSTPISDLSNVSEKVRELPCEADEKATV